MGFDKIKTCWLKLLYSKSSFNVISRFLETDLKLQDV